MRDRRTAGQLRAFFINMVSLLVGGFVLILFWSDAGRREYLWFALMLITGGLGGASGLGFGQRIVDFAADLEYAQRSFRWAYDSLCWLSLAFTIQLVWMEWSPKLRQTV